MIKSADDMLRSPDTESVIGRGCACVCNSGQNDKNDIADDVVDETCGCGCNKKDNTDKISDIVEG